jgi:hypothetical protein
MGLESQRFKVDAGCWLLTISGFCGFLLGFGHSDWQYAAEHAQVIAGIVNYPVSSPVGTAYAKLWSVVAQIGALLLSLGISELALSKILSGMLGLISFQALAVVIYALSRNSLLAIGAPFVIFISGAVEHGVVYPIWLLGSPHTYGVLGLSFIVLAIALVGLGWYRTGAFLVGMAPAIHVALGIWVILIAVVAAFPADRNLRPVILTCSRFLTAGMIAAIASFAAHRAMAPSVVEIDPVTATHYLHGFVPFWDGHRRPVDLRSEGVMLNALAITLAGLWLICFQRSLSPNQKFLLRFVAIGGLLSLGLACWTTLPGAWMPDWLLVLMPGRLLNVNVILTPALLFGLTSTLRPTILAETITLTLAMGLLVSRQSAFWRVPEYSLLNIDNLVVLSVGFANALCAALLVSDRRWPSAAAFVRPYSGPMRLIRLFVIRALLVSTLGIAAGTATVDAAKAGKRALTDWTTDPLLQAAARGHGPLLKGAGLWAIQLRTRRPVLLDGDALDNLPYALESAPATERILLNVYGIDLFRPPTEARHRGRVPLSVNRDVWEALSREQWQQIGSEYGVSQVLTRSGWKLDLPLVAQSPDLELYTVPY